MAVLLGGRAFAQINTPPADSRADAQSVGKPSPLTLRTRIPLPGVYGRMDHYGWDSKRGVLIVSALGNDTVEIVNSWKRVHTITGLEHPQASVYVPGVDRIVVSSQSGKLRFYDAETYNLLKMLDFGTDTDTDNMRYDPLSKRVYVGYGRGTRGALAIVDPSAMERMEEFKLGSHPESFQLERDGPRIFVNLPDQGAIGVIDRKTGALTKWQIPSHTNTLAMALDEASYMDNINWTKGIDQKTGKPLDYDPAKDLQTYSGIANHTLSEPVRKVCPTILGGNNYWPSSYSPRTKLLYVPALTGCDDVKLDTEMHSKAKGWNGGTHTATDRLESNLTAIDPITGDIKKNIHLRYPNVSGTLATAGGLIFLGLTDGTVAAYDDVTLAELWKTNVGSGFNAPPMTFEVNGKQYVAIATGLYATGKHALEHTPELKDQRNATVLYVFGL